MYFKSWLFLDYHQHNDHQHHDHQHHYHQHHDQQHNDHQHHGHQHHGHQHYDHHYHLRPQLPEGGKGVCEGEGNGKAAEEQVANGKVDHEDVSWGPHCLWMIIDQSDDHGDYNHDHADSQVDQENVSRGSPWSW